MTEVYFVLTTIRQKEEIFLNVKNIILKILRRQWVEGS